MSNVIICNGGYRTGSTLSFNILRLLHKELDIECQSMGANPETVFNMVVNEEDWVCIAKVHHWNPPDTPTIKTVHTKRSPYEVASSMQMLSKANKRPVDWDVAIQSLITAKELTEAMKAKSNALVIGYEKLMKYPFLQICRVVNFLGLEIPVGNMMMKRIIEETKVDNAIDVITDMKGEACPVTQLRKYHIGKYKGEPGLWDLPPEIVERIRDEVEHPNIKFMDDMEGIE